MYCAQPGSDCLLYVAPIGGYAGNARHGSVVQVIDVDQSGAMVKVRFQHVDGSTREGWVRSAFLSSSAPAPVWGSSQ